MPENRRFDAIVVGGGPAGLIAATYLARFRRSVLVVDADRSRVARIPRSHNYPGMPEGIAGPELLAALRAQVAAYPIETMTGTVDDSSAMVKPFEPSGRAAKPADRRCCSQRGQAI